MSNKDLSAMDFRPAIVHVPTVFLQLCLLKLTYPIAYR